MHEDPNRTIRNYLSILTTPDKRRHHRDITMSDEENTSVSYDYSSYNDNAHFFTPCTFTDLQNFGKVFLPILYCLVFILGFVGNGLVVCVLVKHRHQTNLTDICLFNLSVSDLLFVITLPFYSHFARVEWTFGDFLCHFISGAHSTGFFSSIFFMVVMTLDRYVVIMHVHTVARYRTLRTAIALTIFVWMLSLSVSLPVFIFTKVTNESQGLSCDYLPENKAWELYNIFATNILGLIIPLMVMVICYSRIIPTLVNMRTSKKHRVVKLIISIVAIFFLFWFPYNISLFLRFLKYETILSLDCNQDAHLRLSVTVTEAFAYTHCCLNPIIYAFVGQKFMKRALHLLRKLMPGIPLLSARDLSDSSFRKSSVLSRSSEVNSTFIK